ncbi:MAG: transketolase C-terminal domain-containing protein [Deltaproteobacteria bacterium]|nr:transketolase C-terminal domain-containing protein [Deltaproteobacteria bacterium]
MNTVMDACQTRDDIFIVTGDAGLGVFDEFKDTYPDKFLNLGVAEQNMIGFSAGLSLTGFKVYVYNIIPFVLYRCYEQVRNDICYQKLPVTLVGIGSGITYAPGGMTHYSVEDIGIAQTLPNLTVISPIDPVEAKLAAQYSLEANEPVYIRLAKRGEPAIHDRDKFDITLPQVVKEGADVAILFHGSISVEVMKAYEELIRGEIYPLLVSIPMLQPLQKESLLDILKKMKHVICVEEHFENCGLGNIMRKVSLESHSTWKLKTMGIPYQFIHEIKNTESMREHFGISSSDIVRTVKDIAGGVNERR